MLTFLNYTDLKLIHENQRIQIYRGYTGEKRMPVIIKALKKEVVTPLEMAKLIQEYEITRSINIDGIVRPVKLEQVESSLVMVMEDVGAICLKDYMQASSLDLKQILDLGVQLAQILDQLHQNDIIHRDLKPENILIDPATRKSYIIDFSSALLLTPRKENAMFSRKPVGTPEYMPPEQTGRLNLLTDQRSDLYSLGIILYELTTGRLPFSAENPAQLIYAHITQIPEPPARIKPDLPPVISDIIMKLIAKAQEDRYQSAYGLYWDLKKCLEEFNKLNNNGYFPIGRVDVIGRFQLPERLYGREREMELLKAAYSRVSGGKSETILVSGYAGVGKTMLVLESFKPYVLGKGYFIKGKFDQLKKNIPYGPFASAFADLMIQHMSESQEELDRWKRRILRALGKSGAIMTELVPQLAWIIGEQPPVDMLPPKEAENRFLMIFKSFIQVFARPAHPLVLFLDDLQWADPASVQLFKYLSREPDISSFLLIGAFRENELIKGSLLEELLDIADRTNPEMMLLVQPLEREKVGQLVADVLFSTPGEVNTLAEVVYRRTGGNPFFVRQFLTLIHYEKLLFFDKVRGSWTWQLDAIEKLELGEDVLELLLKKLYHLPEETLETMKLAACLGSRFDLETLTAVKKISPEETAAGLMPAVREGLIFMNKSFREQSLTDLMQELPVFTFLHDRIQQAVASLMPEQEKKEKHLSIGRLLLEKTDSASLEEKILIIMDHFNRSLELVHDPEEKIKLAGYNLLAGRKAKSSTAYTSALEYFRSGIKLLAPDAWVHAYQLTYDLHLELAQAEYLSANVKHAEELFDIVIAKAGSEIERASVYGLKVILYASMGKYAEAAEMGIRALAKLGVKVPVHPGKLDYVREFLRFKWYMRNKKVEDLLLLPDLKDPVQAKIAELMSRVCSVTLSSNQDLYGLMLLKAGNHAARYGNSVSAPVGYFGYSFTAANVLGDYQAGERFGQVCLQLVERNDRCSFKCVIYFTYGSFISHWTRHAKFGLEYLKKAAQTGMEAGDVMIIGYAHCLILELHYLLGVSLEKIAGEIVKKQEMAARLKHENFTLATVIYEKVVTALSGREAGSLASGAQEFQKEKILDMAEHDQSSLATFYFCKMQLHYLAGEYDHALTAAENGQVYLKAISGFLLSAEYCFYHSLVITAIYDKLSFWDRKRLWKVLCRNKRQMKKWSEACQENFRHKYILIAAEIARLQQQEDKAMSWYDQAILSARENGYFQHEALANELAARFYLSKGLIKIARTYLLDACRGYHFWGARAKVAELKDRYPDLLEDTSWEEKNEVSQKDSSPMIISDLIKITSSLDSEIASTIETHHLERTADSISRETDLNKLLENFLDSAIQNTGADKGFFILEKDGELFIEAFKDGSKDLIEVKTIPLEESQELSRSIVRYVARTLETVVINSREDTGIFASDAYVVESNARSIACLPLMFQGIPVGVLYFENSLIPGVFTQERFEAMKIFSAQLAYVKKLQSYLEDNTGKDKRKTNQNLILEPLTERETDVLQLIAEGLSNKEIADKLEITVNTVKGYIKNIYEKLGVNRRVQAVTRAKELGILQKR